MKKLLRVIMYNVIRHLSAGADPRRKKGCYKQHLACKACIKMLLTSFMMGELLACITSSSLHKFHPTCRFINGYTSGLYLYIRMPHHKITIQAKTDVKFLKTNKNGTSD